VHFAIDPFTLITVAARINIPTFSMLYTIFPLAIIGIPTTAESKFAQPIECAAFELSFNSNSNSKSNSDSDKFSRQHQHQHQQLTTRLIRACCVLCAGAGAGAGVLVAL
jgi:hypothetical protein